MARAAPGSAWKLPFHEKTLNAREPPRYERHFALPEVGVSTLESVAGHRMDIVEYRVREHAESKRWDIGVDREDRAGKEEVLMQAYELETTVLENGIIQLPEISRFVDCRAGRMFLS